MGFAPGSFSTDKLEIWVLFAMRDYEAAQQFHRLRACLRGDCDVQALDEDHLVPIVKSGGARRLTG
jgi:hypothetical protein